MAALVRKAGELRQKTTYFTKYKIVPTAHLFTLIPTTKMVISRVGPPVVKSSKFVVRKMGPPLRKSSRLFVNAAKPHVQRSTNAVMKTVTPQLEKTQAWFYHRWYQQLYRRKIGKHCYHQMRMTTDVKF
ncbi:uncharacterized protein LOC128554272 [Mercenaria mercenaria]|uniref:uncharacterized protein LOC128554272 n=1 Tax=Mercenaria mercenaria TaxID=6596 RepID=UPI00234FB095|nr:uncharacterized protein LOC128554272 [Mercenaria mercenaria]